MTDGGELSPPVEPIVPATCHVELGAALAVSAARDEPDTPSPQHSSSPQPPPPLSEKAIAEASTALAVTNGSKSVPSTPAATPSASHQPKLPVKALLVVYAIVASDAMALNISNLLSYIPSVVHLADSFMFVCVVAVTPFVSDICVNRYGMSESEVGGFAGFLLGSFSFAVFFSSFIIGHLSDLYGRKPMIVIGLLSSTIVTLFFPITTSVGVAIALRLFGGLTNGNTALTKAVMSDVTDHAETRALAFAYQGAAFQAARAISSAVGGVTVGLIVFGYENPFFLPCFLGALLSILTCVATAVWMPETITQKQPKPSKSKPSHKRSTEVIPAAAANNNIAPANTANTANSELVYGPGAPPPKSKTDCRTLCHHIFRDLMIGLRVIRNDRLVLKLFLINLMNSFSNGSLLLLLVLYPALSIQNGGLSMNDRTIGLVFSWFGAIGMLFQVCLYKPLYKRMGGLHRTYIIGSILLGSTSFLTPFISVFYWIYPPSINADENANNPNQRLAAGLTIASALILWGLMSIGFMICLPVVGAMLSNATDPSRQGLVQGSAQSVASLSRGIGPMITGIVFSQCIPLKFTGFAFWMLMASNIGCLIISYRMTPDEVDRINAPRKEKERKNSITASRKRSGSVPSNTINTAVTASTASPPLTTSNDVAVNDINNALSVVSVTVATASSASSPANPFK